MERELKRGTLEMVLLRLLARREMYGYELVTALREHSDGGLEVKDGTLYPVLYRLEEAGFVEPYWETRERGVPRKYYRLTEEGEEESRRRVGEWRDFVETIERILREETDE